MAISAQKGNVTLGSPSSSVSAITITGAGSNYNNSVLTVTNGTGVTAAGWSNMTKTTARGQMHLEGEDADLIINGTSMKKLLDSITDRLAILQPKPDLLAKYENLREAYEHYKTLEALLHEQENP